MTIESEQIDSDDLMPEQAQAMVDEALADLAAGRVVSHGRVISWLTRRLRGEQIPLPSFEVDRPV